MVKKEVMERVLALLKNQEKMEEVKDSKSVSEVYAALSEDLSGISEEEFADALKEIREGEVNLNEADLEAVAGGIAGDTQPGVVAGLWL